MKRLTNKVAIVTGGAHGIGATIGRRFAEEGAFVTVADIDEERGGPLAAQLGAQFVRVDLSDHEACGRLVDEVVSSRGGLDCVVSNAVIHRSGTAAGTSLELWNEVQKTNLAPTYSLAHFGTPYLRQRRGASFLIISSVQAMVGFKNFTAYAAAKGGQLGMMRQLAADLAPEIRVNAISPGTVRSYPELVDEEVEQMWGKLHLLGRIGECEEVANAALFLASDEASFITGHNLVVDGGLTAWGGV